MPVHAKFNRQEALYHWSISSRTLKQLVDHFGPGTEYLEVNTDGDHVNFTCFSEKTISDDGMMLRLSHGAGQLTCEQRSLRNLCIPRFLSKQTSLMTLTWKTNSKSSSPSRTFEQSRSTQPSRATPLQLDIPFLRGQCNYPMPATPSLASFSS
jgi:hypothetical protein